MRSVIATLSIYLALVSSDALPFDDDGLSLELPDLTTKELLEALNITGMDIAEEEPVHRQKLNIPDQSNITTVPYARCLINNRRLFGTRLLEFSDDSEQSLVCLKDGVKISVQNNTCGVFPACTVGWDDEHNVQTVTCSRTKVYIISVFTFLFSLAIVLANLLIIFVVCRTKSLRTPQGLFKLSLSFAALLLGVFYLPSSAYYMLQSIFYDERDRLLVFGHVVPDHDYYLENTMNVSQLSEAHKEEVRSAVTPSYFLTVISLIQSVVTVYSLFLLAFDRFLSVRWPVRYRVGEIMTKKRAASLILLVWMLAIVISLVVPFASGDRFLTGRLLTTFTDVLVIDKERSSTAGNFTDDLNTELAPPSLLQEYWHGILFAVLVWILPFVATWILTIALMVRSHTMLNRMRHSRRSSKGGRSLNRVDRSLIMTVVVMLSLFTITTFPLFATIIDSIINRGTNPCFRPFTVYGMFIGFYLYTISSFCNLLIYNIFQKDFRQSAAKVFGMPCLDPMARADAAIRRNRKSASTSSSTSTKRTLSATISNTIASGITSMKRGKSSTKKPSTSSSDGGSGGRKETQLPAARVSSDASTSTKSSDVSLN